MEKSTKRNIISAVLCLIFIGLIALFALVDINLNVINFSSVEGIISKRQELVDLEESLQKSENNYSTSKSQLATTQSSFTTAKNKYEAISDATINLIKEATTQENYDIEYMWIRLGNYASMNNLSIVLVEPGGNKSEETNNIDVNASVDVNNGENKSETNSQTTDTANDSDTIMTITLEGSYLNISDFIFEVENDKELRFKLDNIEMTYLEGTKIRTKFDVKNVIVLK